MTAPSFRALQRRATQSEQDGRGQLWNVTTRTKIGPPIAAGNSAYRFPYIFNPGGILLATTLQSAPPRRRCR